MSGFITGGQQAAAGRATSDETVAALQQAMGVISSVCDYAQQLDARGFSAADAWLGHVLAQMPPGLWSDSVALAAWDMLRKYRGQLAAAAISYDELPRPAGADELEAGRREGAREQARGCARAWREHQYRQTRCYLRCDGDEEQVTLAFPYDPDLVAGCRKIDGRRYDGAAKANVFPFTSLPAVIELAAAHGIEVTADVRALAAIAAGRAAERAVQPQVRLGEPDGTIIIDASLDPALYEKVRELGGRWDSAARVHRVPGHHAPELADLAGQHGLQVGVQVRELAASTSGRHEGNRAAAGAFEADPVPVPGLASGLALKPQQYPVVRFALEHRRVLIGDDMGWGKTLSSLAAVAADGAYPAVVVCRPSLTLNWAAEIARFFPGLTVAEAAGTRPRPVPAGTDVIIIGSAALAARPRKTPSGGREFGWAEELKKAGPKALIIDEGQDTKERAANRSQACEQLAAAVIARDGLVLDLTGTAILNRPRELCQQLTILGRIAEFGGPKKFLWRYCLSETNAWGASYDGARNLIELHDRLRAWGIMIRRSDDAALGLPPCREHVLPIPLADLDAAVMTRYRRAEADLLGFLAEQARQAAQKLGEDPDSAAVAAAMRASAAEHLVAINTLRQLAGQAKRGYVTRWVRQHVTAGEKVMIAAHHRDEVDAYAAAFGGLKLQGGQPVTEKEAVKARFQSQPPSQAPVIVVAIGAGGVGHTLTAAAIGIQAEQAWTPGETQQMKKRLHRIGQDRDVDYYITVAETTIDEHLQSVVTAKQATLDAVLDGQSDTGIPADGKSVAAELAWRLTRQGLATRAGDDRASGTLTGLSPGSAPPDQQDTAPAAEWSWKWSGDLIKVYAGSSIAGRVYRDQGPRGTFYRAETASDPYRSLASDREVARHLTGIDAAVAALRADRDRGHREPADENSPDDDAPGHAAGSPIPDTPLPHHAAAALAAPPGTCIVPGCGQRGRRYPAGTLCDTHRPGPEPPPPQACPECGLAVPAHATACTQRPASPWPATEVSYGQRDEITVRQWQETHLDPDKVWAWCRDTGRGEPPVSGALPPGLINDYLTDRGATDIPLPGGPDRSQWLAQRPVLTGPFTARLGPLTVTYGPCPRCGHPTAADPGDPLPLCTDCASQPGDHGSAAGPTAGSGELTRDAAPGNRTGQPAEPGPAAPGGTGGVPPGQVTGQQMQEAASRPASGSGRPSVTSSTLDEAALAAMRADAEATAGPFTDPELLRKAELALEGIDAAWLQRVVGHPAGSWRSLGHAEMLLAVRAAETDTEHLAALAESDRRKLAMQRQATAAAAQATADAAAAQWQQLRDQLPVPVTVQHNWTARHLDGYEQGADHIVVLEDLDAGRLRRAAGKPLCHTPSRARQLRHVSANTGDERRLPNCAACLRHAEQLAATRQTSSTAQPGTGGHAATPAAASPQHPPPPAPAPAGNLTHGTGPGSGGDASPPGKPGTSASDDDDETSAQAQITGKQLREAAHRYLEDGLLPVPAWAPRANGGCCCPRGAGCGRPGKHPRSVRSGPGPRDYSWKPLTCRTHAEIDQRFADDSPYAAGNLMVAIPEGMMAIDVDDDDGGRAAAAGLAGELGELPLTLAHGTPHGEHLIYHTPPGWKGRAWVGKDPSNPLPPGIDLRMPGQILMAAPSIVPGPDGPARYGPVTGDHVAALPAPYVTAWTPPQPLPQAAGRRVPVPPDSASRAARYVHEAMTRIADDLASHQPGGRNAAAYAAGLKAGSLLGAARSTPGAEHAAWTDEQAEEALMDAAERNGYTGKDGPAEARRSIRSGLHNGLSAPRALPDFTASPAPDQRQPPRRTASSGTAYPQRSQTGPGQGTGRWQDMVPGDIRRQIEAADRAASDRRRTAIAVHQQALERHSQAPTADTAAEVERTRAAARAAHQAYTHDGRHVTGRHDAAMLRWAAAIAAQRGQDAAQSASAAGTKDTARMQANRAAVAANAAYKARDLDRAGKLTEQAAALDPSRAGLWQQHRNDIAARRLITAARAAYADADHERAGQLLQDARQLDPRLRTLWDSGLPAQPATQPGRPGPGPGGTAPETHGTGGTRRPAATAQPNEGAPRRAWPSPPIRRDPDRAAPAVPRPAGTRPAAQRPAHGSGPREPRTAAPASGQDPDAGAGDDAARWPSTSLRSQEQAMARPTAADRETRTVPQPPAAGDRHPGPAGAGSGASADWRDEILSEARQPWQPGPNWPHHPAIHRTPETATPEPGIEPGR